MMNLEEIIQSIQGARSLPSDDDLRSLPCKRAFIYGRVSSREQVRESQESIREIAKLVELARKDGYKTSLEPTQVEKWLESIQSGAETGRVIEEGEVTVDCRDLGLSGSLGEDRRPGLADLWRRVESGEVGTVYLTEGMSRLSRDRDRILGYKLLKLLKERQCRVRTPEGIYNPAIRRDWDYLAEDVEDSAEEMKKAGIRLGRRRAQKAAVGEHVGSPVCPGYIVAIEGRRSDGSYVLGKWQPYPPHQEVVVRALREIVKQRSIYKAVQSLQVEGVVFPFFPEELKWMETRSVLRNYLTDSRGYLITYNALKGLATNLRLIGIWQWRDILIENNHPAIVPVDLFLQAYEIAGSKKPKGRAAYAEPMDWAGLLYCYDYDEPVRLTALNTQRRWACRQTYPLRSTCFETEDHILTTPLTREFLRCLDLTPHAQAVLERLRTEVNERSLEDTQCRAQVAALKTRIVNLERCLGSGDPEREKTYWRLIKEAKAQLDYLSRRPTTVRSTAFDIERVSQFLENLESEWGKYPSRLRNRLLTLLVDRVELRHTSSSQIEATIAWKAGFRQVVIITQPATNFSRDKRWRTEEDSLLHMLWPSSSQQAILAAFPGRTWEAISLRAVRLKIGRKWMRTNKQTGQRWTEADKEHLRQLYAEEKSLKEIARKLGRSEGAVTTMASIMGICRPKELHHRRLEPTWQGMNIKVFQESSSP